MKYTILNNNGGVVLTNVNEKELKSFIEQFGSNYIIKPNK